MEHAFPERKCLMTNFNTKPDMANWLGGNSNSHPTNTLRRINCCIDYITFVFPYSPKNKYNVDTTYRDVYEEYKSHLPDLDDNELFKLIENDFPGIQPGIRYIKAFDDNEEDDSGLWSFNKIQTALIHWCKLSKLIPESSSQHIISASGYKFVRMFTNNINIKSDGPDMIYTSTSGVERKYSTCSIEISGSGCRLLEEYGIDLLNLIGMFYKIPGAHATRIDNATDLINDNQLTMDWLKNKIFNEVSFISKFKSIYKPKGLYKIKTSDSRTKYLEEHGDSIEFGSRTSTSMLVIYDKLLEREEKLGLQVEADSWLRFELRCFEKKADTLAKKLAYEIKRKEYANFSSSILYDHLDIKDKNIKCDGFRSNQQNSWATDLIWAHFVGCVSKTKLVSQNKIEADFVKTRSWFDRAAMTTQATLGLMYEDDERTKINSLEREIEVLKDFKDDQLLALNQYRKKVYKIEKDLTYQDIVNRINKLIKERDDLINKYKKENCDDL